MPLLIDCYNLLHAPMPPSLAGLDEDALCRLLAASPWAKERITIVCDGNPKPHAPASPVPQVQLIYSGPQRTADDVIIDQINEDSAPRRLYVVSDDRQIQKAARRRRASPLANAPFIRGLASHRVQSPAPDALGRHRPQLSEEQTKSWLEEFGIDPDDPQLDVRSLPPEEAQERLETMEEEIAKRPRNEAVSDDEVEEWMREFGVDADEPIDPREREWWEGE
ncbi:MAG: NYN domain-containing protein [Phycisphaeraceae bacterium]